VKPVSIPFAYDDLSVDNVLADQFANQDVIQEANVGYATTYLDGFGWFGDLVEFAYGGAYNVLREADNGNLDYYLLGTVDPQPISIPFAGNGQWTAFSLNEATGIGLTENFFNNSSNSSDQLQESAEGLLTTYIDGFGWFGDLETLEPTTTFSYYVVQGAPGFTFNYPSGRGLSQPNPSFRSK